MSNSAPSFMRQHVAFEQHSVCVFGVFSFHPANPRQGSPSAWSARRAPPIPVPQSAFSSSVGPAIPLLCSPLHLSGPSHLATSPQIILSYLCLLSQHLLPIPDLTWDPISLSTSTGLVGHFSASLGGLRAPPITIVCTIGTLTPGTYSVPGTVPGISLHNSFDP